jgi:heat shock protein HslJ
LLSYSSIILYKTYTGGAGVRNTFIKILVLLFLAGALWLAACGTGAEALEDKTWVLESYGEPDSLKTVLGNSEITATFESAEETVRGTAGCNHYFGGYEVKGSQLSFPGPIASTEMSCGEQLDKQEREYLNALMDAESFKIEGDKLTINCGQQVLIFELE